MEKTKLQKGNSYYYSRILGSPIYITEVIQLKIRTIESDYVVGIDVKTSQAFPLQNSDVDERLFEHRDKALKLCKEFDKQFGEKKKEMDRLEKMDREDLGGE